MDNFVRRMRHYVDIDTADLTPLFDLNHRHARYEPGQTIIALNEPVNDIHVMVSGWSMRARYLDDGRRQIINFQLPGDYFDLMSLVGAKSDHTISAATESILRIYDGNEFRHIIQENPKLASAFWWVTVQEETILRQQIVRIGRMSARERIANFILELNRRQNIGSGKREDFVPLPVPQALLADGLGLSIVHVSRSLTSLKAQGLLKTSRRGIEIIERDKLMEIAEYNPAHMETRQVSLATQ